MSGRELYLVFSFRPPCRQLSLHGHGSYLAQDQGHRSHVQPIELTHFPDRHGLVTALVCLSSVEMLPLQTLEPARNGVILLHAVQKAQGQTSSRDDVCAGMTRRSLVG